MRSFAQLLLRNFSGIGVNYQALLMDEYKNTNYELKFL